MRRLISNAKRAVCYIVPCLLTAIALNFSKFLETETVRFCLYCTVLYCTVLYCTVLQVRFCLDFTACGCGYDSKLYVRPTRLRLSQVAESRA